MVHESLLSDFGTAVGRAYGAFYTTGSIPQDQAKLNALHKRTPDFSFV